MERDAYDEMSVSENIHWWFVARRSILQKVIGHCLLNRQEKNILEVGCGSGGNLKMLSTLGKISAMEGDDVTRDFANNRNICLVKQGKLPDNIPFDSKFDLICMLDVLEHIEDDTEALLSIKDYLATDGKLLITVPAYQFLWSNHDVVNHHKRRYTHTQLKNLVTRTGFKIKYLTYFNTILFPIIALGRVWNIIFSRHGGSDVKMPSAPINYLLTKVFSFERFFLTKMFLPFGVSILLIVEKS